MHESYDDVLTAAFDQERNKNGPNREFLSSNTSPNDFFGSYFIISTPFLPKF